MSTTQGDDASPVTGGGAGQDDGPEPVGAADVAADRAASGADAGDAGAPEERRDSEGVPVGRADAEADAARTGADPEAV